MKKLLFFLLLFVFNINALYANEECYGTVGIETYFPSAALEIHNKGGSNQLVKFLLSLSPFSTTYIYNYICQSSGFSATDCKCAYAYDPHGRKISCPGKSVPFVKATKQGNGYSIQWKGNTVGVPAPPQKQSFCNRFFGS